MGLLSTGTSLTWEEIEHVAAYIKEHGIQQFITIFDTLKARQNDLLKYGDEIEYFIIYLDAKRKSARLGLRANEVLNILQEQERLGQKLLDSLWRMEYASYMVEGTPGKPFCCTISRLKLIEPSMVLRKQELDKVLKEIDPNLESVCFSAFPRIGCFNFTEPNIDIMKIENRISKSAFFPDEAIFLDHPRFANLTRNIRSRLGRKQRVYVPIWHDKNTPRPFIETIPSFADQETRDAVQPDHIYMDCMGFGMGCSCLQITVQAGNLMEARNLYDQLAVIAPVLMPLSAASPAWKGLLSDWDCRWKIISMACDDRRPDELSGENSYKIRKSRYDSIDMYLHPDHEKYNDVSVQYSSEHYETLLKAGVDRILAKHVAHLFSRDPISLFKEKLHIDDRAEVDHFENLQSTNWQSCRFKPPPLNGGIGWRVEFRTLEVQFTCYENACFVIFVILLSRAIIKCCLNILVPISIMEKNMERAILRDAVHKSKFFFRTNVINKKDENGNEIDEGCQLSELSLDEIFNGKMNAFMGLIPIIRLYIENLDLDSDTKNCVEKALRFVSDRANGKIMTPATWIRHQVRSHPKYAFNSVISEEVLYDITCKIRDLSNNVATCDLLYEGHNKASVSPEYIEAYKNMIKIESMGDKETKLGVMTPHSRKITAALHILRWEVFESLFKQYLFYNNPVFKRHRFGEIFL